MRVIGEIATIGVGVVVLAGLAVGIYSIPDIKRYLRIRHM